jgi:hypothetical protein
MKLSSVLKTVITCGLVFGAPLAMAVGVSVVDTSVTDQMTTTQDDILTIGGYVIGSAVLAFAISWVKATFF